MYEKMSFILRIIISFVLIFIIEYYFIRKVYTAANTIYPPVPKDKYYKWATVILIVINIYPLWLLAAWAYASIAQTGRPRLPESKLFDFLIMYPFWIAVLTIIQSVLLFLLVDLFRLLVSLFARSYKSLILRWQSYAVAAVLILTIIYVPVRIIYDFNSVSVRHTSYSSPGIPDQLKGLKIGFIADIQADRYNNRDRLDNYISRLNEEKPDLVLIAGDVITSGPDHIETAAEFLGMIEAPYGVYSCVGDHDHWVYREDNPRSIREIIAALDKYGVKMIDNNTHKIDFNGAGIGISFVTYTYPRRASLDLLNELTSDIENSDLKIFLVHQPGNELAQFAADNNYNLFLAGHTHGGQITFLFPFINLSPTLVETRFVRGDFNLNGMLKIVNRGLGMSLVPIRLNSTPEITIITIN
jgi:uncharacterized protein